MQDRPTADELLAAVEHFLDELTATLDGSQSFHTRVAANAVRIVRRELEDEDSALATEWAGLDSILGALQPPESRADLRQRLRDRNDELCAQIRSGEADDGPGAQAIFDHVRTSLRSKLHASDPGLLGRSESV